MFKKAVILAGGMGTRIREETEFRPKPMVEIGGMPILWHIMKNLNVQGVQEFIICLGYKGEQIKEFFENYNSRISDMIVDTWNSQTEYLIKETREKWKVTLVDTGLNTMTGGRINRIRAFTDSEPFLCTYGDGLANIKVDELFACHKKFGRIGTVTAVHPSTRFGTLDIDQNSEVKNFAEKPPSVEWVNGGFFIFEQEIFNYLDDNCVLEQKPLIELAKKGGLTAYKHDGFWRPMDTFRESKELNDLYQSNAAPWVNWK